MNDRDRIVVTAMHVRPFYGGAQSAVFQAELVHRDIHLTDLERDQAAAHVETMFGSFSFGEWVRMLTPQELNAMVSGFDNLQLGDERSVMGTYLAEAANKEERRRVQNDLPVTYKFSGREQS